MISNDPRWSLPRGNPPVPSGWQATAGPAIALTIGHMYQRYVLDGAPLTLLAASLGIAGSYAAAAFLTMRQGHRVARIGLAVAIFALLPLSLM